MDTASLIERAKALRNRVSKAWTDEARQAALEARRSRGGSKAAAYFPMDHGEFAVTHYSQLDGIKSRKTAEALRMPGAKNAQWSAEALSRVHSAATHHSLRVEGKGERFRQAAERAGFKVLRNY